MNIKEYYVANKAEHKNSKYLERFIDQLNDENQRYFLGVLEALNFAQNADEIPAYESSGVAQQ